MKKSICISSQSPREGSVVILSGPIPISALADVWALNLLMCIVFILSVFLHVSSRAGV